jgi:hypothetical protein
MKSQRKIIDQEKVIEGNRFHVSQKQAVGAVARPHQPPPHAKEQHQTIQILLTTVPTDMAYRIANS